MSDELGQPPKLGARATHSSEHVGRSFIVESLAGETRVRHFIMSQGLGTMDSGINALRRVRVKHN